MKRKAPALRNIGIDLDARALESFRYDYPVELVHGCAHEFLDSFPFLGRELVYCDPPYLHQTRRSDFRYATTTGKPTTSPSSNYPMPRGSIEVGLANTRPKTRRDRRSGPPARIASGDAPAAEHRSSGSQARIRERPAPQGVAGPEAIRPGRVSGP